MSRKTSGRIHKDNDILKEASDFTVALDSHKMPRTWTKRTKYNSFFNDKMDDSAENKSQPEINLDGKGFAS